MGRIKDIVLICVCAFFVLFFDMIMNVVMDLIEVLEHNMGSTVAVLTGISLLSAHLLRFFRAWRLGVPVRISFASVYDGIEILLEITFVIGFGVVAPLWLGSLTIDEGIKQFLLIATLLSVYTVSFAKLYILACQRGLVKRTALKTLTKLIMSIMISIMCFLTASSFLGIKVTDYGTPQMIGIHFLIVAMILVIQFLLRVTGNHRAEITCFVDGEMYLLGIRSTTNEWLLLPCRIYARPREKYFDDYGNEVKCSRKIHFLKSRYIVKNIKEVGVLTAQHGYGLIADRRFYFYNLPKNMSENS